jgi:hypothetical protein
MSVEELLCVSNPIGNVILPTTLKTIILRKKKFVGNLKCDS